ncbi:TIGR03086 family metal-binding protein [Pseudonocardia hispaniensis]|uniref:TIGR03086 family metal-binding protein n=1 Tax=Pseudonocardia hispaniensis TaxID=904933 RepID=A0ABW1J7J4_9PSEU
MDRTDQLCRSVDLAVAAVRDAPVERYADPSPCPDFTVGRLVNHLAFGLLLAERSATREPWDETWSVDDDAPFLRGLRAEQWARACARQGERTASAWTDPAVWDGDSHLGGAAMPAAAIGSLMTAEFVLHAWDLAAATGGRLEVPAGLADAVLAGVAGIAPMGRDGGWFGPEVPVPADAPAFERALGLSGRNPSWRAPVSA